MVQRLRSSPAPLSGPWLPGYLQALALGCPYRPEVSASQATYHGRLSLVSVARRSMQAGSMHAMPSLHWLMLTTTQHTAFDHGSISFSHKLVVDAPPGGVVFRIDPVQSSGIASPCRKLRAAALRVGCGRSTNRHKSSASSSRISSGGSWHAAGETPPSPHQPAVETLLLPRA